MPQGCSRRDFIGGCLAAIGAASPVAAQPRTYGSIAKRESQYATTYVDRDGAYLTMRFGVNSCLFTETRYNPDDPSELPVVYTRYMTVALAYAANPSRVIEIGLGGGRLASYLHDFVPQAKITCVELDPGVVDLAVSHFGVRPGPRLELVTGDGRVYMARAREKFDVVLIDAYQGTLVPFHLVTREYYGILKRRLAPGGVVAQNIAPKVLDAPRMVATARGVFEHVDLYRAGNNFVLIAYDGAGMTDDNLRARAAGLRSAGPLRYPLEPMIAERVADVVADQREFTDDFAPVGYGDYDRRCRAGAG